MSETTVLKVLLHCDGCVMKVKRYIRRLDGVESFHIDKENSKVTVIGKVKPQVVLDQVLSAKKTAEFWPDEAIGGDVSGNKIPFSVAAVEGKSNSVMNPVDTVSKKRSQAEPGSEAWVKGSNCEDIVLKDDSNVPELENARDLEKQMLVGKSPMKKKYGWATRKPLR